MRASNLILLTGILLAACKKETKIIENVTYDNTIFQVDDQVLYSSNAQKNKQKSTTQFISILYADLFQTAVPGDVINDVVQLTLATGDKQATNELLVFNALNAPGVIIPTKAEMNADVDAFLDDTYVRFYLRKPTELERYYLGNLIQTDTSITPELIYSAFSLSNEYLFY